MNTDRSSEKWVDIALALAPWSIRGHIKIQPLADWPTLQRIDHWHWQSADGLRAQNLQCVERRALDGRHPAVRFEGINERDGAKTLSGGVFRVRRDDLPLLELGAYYWHDLLGLAVSNKEGIFLGSVSRVDETLANVFIEVRPPAPSSAPPLLIPFVAQYIVSVNLPTKSLVVDWQDDWH